MDLKNPKGTSYLLSQTLINSIKVYGGDKTIYVAFNNKNRLLSYSYTNCYDAATTKIYQTKIEAIYIFLIIDFYSDIDFLLMKIIHKRILLNISLKDMAKSMKITVEEYIEIEEGNIELTEKMKRGICRKLNIKAKTKIDYINIYFKQIK